jgi:hypothetical protein
MQPLTEWKEKSLYASFRIPPMIKDGFVTSYP